MKFNREQFLQYSNKFVSKVGKIAANKHLAALRDGFALSLPLTIAGAIAILFITIIFGGWNAEKTSLLGLIAHASGNTKVTYSHMFDSATAWKLSESFAEIRAFGVQVFSWINAASLGSISLYLVLLISFSIAVIKGNKNPMLVALVSLGVFIVFLGSDTGKYGASGMITAIIASFISSNLFIKIVETKKLELKLPPSVPPAVGRAFGILLPTFVVLLFAASLNLLVSLPYYFLEGNSSLSEQYKLKNLSFLISDLIQQPIMAFARKGGDIGILFSYLLISCFLWFFGIHGPNTIVGIFSPISLLLWIDNMVGGKNVGLEQVWSGFGFMGGSGGTLPLIFLSFILLKKGSPQREIAKFALPSGIFEINEPVIFGFPIVFNFKYFIPFLLGPSLACIWPVIAIKTGIMNAPTILAPWTTPPIIYGLIVTQFDWVSIPVSLLSMASLFLIYLPFILIVKRDENKAAQLNRKKEGVV